MINSVFPRGLLGAACAVVGAAFAAAEAPPAAGLTVEWKSNLLTIRGPQLAGKEITINYLEAYCRSGSTDREWGQTVVGHKTELVSADSSGKRIELEDRLRDGVVVKHVITAREDEVDFQLTAHNPTDRQSEAHWAQPCVRVDKFTGADVKDSGKVVPPYAKKCFLFLDGRLTRLPTEPWADRARYVYGQVYAARGVDRNDVNPRPLSKLVPSNGLCGCFSADEQQILGMAWEPYQEIFQGVITCIHSDFRLGGLKPGETKKIRGKMYVVGADVPALVKRYEKDFPEQVQ